jgi:phage gp46-like protein
MTIDIKFKQIAGNWDIDFSNGDIEMTNGLDTALYLSVLGEKRASPSQVTEATLRRGHFTNEFNDVVGYEVGSLLWLYIKQAANSDKNLSLAQGAVYDGLKWMIEDKIVSKIDVVATRVKGGISFDINLINKLQKDSKYYNVFKAT